MLLWLVLVRVAVVCSMACVAVGILGCCCSLWLVVVVLCCVLLFDCCCVLLCAVVAVLCSVVPCVAVVRC